MAGIFIPLAGTGKTMIFPQRLVETDATTMSSVQVACCQWSLAGDPAYFDVVTGC